MQPERPVKASRTDSMPLANQENQQNPAIPPAEADAGKAASAASAIERVAEIYQAHGSWLTDWLRWKTGCPHNAADLAHDTFVRVIRARNAVDIKEPRAYLTTIARSLMINQLQRREIEQAWLDTLAHTDESLLPSPEQRLIIVETLFAIDAMLNELPAKVRRAFLLCQLEGMRHADIAAQLGVSVSAVRKYLARAMEHCLLFQDGRD